MDFMEKITELRAEKSKLLAQAEALPLEDVEGRDKITDQMEGLNAQIKSLERQAKASADGAAVYDGILHSGEGTKKQADGGAPKLFASLGEQLKAIYDLRKGQTMDDRLGKINAAAGVTGTTGADGGFLLQEDFAGRILESAVQRSPLLNRLDRYTCSSAANSMRWISANETDVSKSVFGGVQMYWAAEGATVAASKPKFREMKLDLEKMMGFCYCTDEMLQDAAFLTGFVGNAFSLAGDRLLTESVISGDGVGKPKGLLNSGAPDHRGQGSQSGCRQLPGDERGEDAGPGHAPWPGAAGVADAPRRGGTAAHPGSGERRRGQVPVEPRGRSGQL